MCSLRGCHFHSSFDALAPRHPRPPSFAYRKVSSTIPCTCSGEAFGAPVSKTRICGVAKTRFFLAPSSGQTAPFPKGRTHAWDHSTPHTTAICQPMQCESQCDCMIGPIRLQDEISRKKVTFVTVGSGFVHQVEYKKFIQFIICCCKCFPNLVGAQCSPYMHY